MSHVFARCVSQKTHGHARIPRVSAKKCDTNHIGPRRTLEDPEVVELSGEVIQSFHQDIPTFVCRANGAEPKMLCVAL